MEYILCAAIYYKELPLLKPEALEGRGSGPYNITEGIVFCGWRHPNCLLAMVAVTGKRQCEAGVEVQGFLTNKNRFVNREEAAVIAMQAQQIKELQFNTTELFSEDLY